VESEFREQQDRGDLAATNDRRIPERPRRILRFRVFQRKTDSRPLHDLELHRELMPFRAGVFGRRRKIMGDQLRRPAEQKIDRPTLVIASSTSPLLDAQRDMAKAIPSARWVVVPNAGHALFVDEPDIFDRELAALLQAAH
jgi:pimeloyl-ACP methyl ester carboxylesterase